MKTPKSLTKLAESANAFVEVITFSGNGHRQKGFAVVDADNNELLEIEPVHYSNGDRWKAINKTIAHNRLTYFKSLSGIDKKISIKAGQTGYKFVSLTTGRNCRPLPYGTVQRT